jgi:hypothetical protein
MSLSADATRQDVPVRLTLHAPGIPLALLVRSAALPGDAGGELHIESQLKAKGPSIHYLAASLDGSFAATMTHGNLSNAALIELASASLQALGIEVPAQDETAIRCFGIVGSFNAGVGRFRTIAQVNCNNPLGQLAHSMMDLSPSLGPDNIAPRRRRGVLSAANLAGGTESLQTPRWREPDSSLGPTHRCRRHIESGSLQAREVEREHQREKRLEQTKEGMVVEMPRPGLRHRPQSAGIAEGEALRTGCDFIAALGRAGYRVEPIERAPVPIAACDP